MEKSLNINAGNATLLNDRLEMFDGYGSVNINCGNVLATRKAYDKLLSMGVHLNCGNTTILDITGEIAELPGKTVITADMSYAGRYLFCDGNLIVQDAKGLDGITGLYAHNLFCPESVSLPAVMGITANRVVYPDGAKLTFADTTLGEDSPIILEGGALHWVHGEITALDGNALEKLRLKNIAFHCKRLTIYAGLYEKYRDMFQADGCTFIPDGYAVTGGISLDAATALLYGEKLYVRGDMMIHHDQAQHLSGFSSLIVNGEVTMPVSAAAAFKAVGKANGYNLYEGALLEMNGVQTLSHDQLQTALNKGLPYSIQVNGVVCFMEGVTAEDVGAVASISCNGVIIAPGTARGALDSKIKEINGTILDFEAVKLLLGEKFDSDDPLGSLMKIQGLITGGGENENTSNINTGNFKL